MKLLDCTAAFPQCFFFPAQPSIDPAKHLSGRTLYWRVAAVDKRGNIGPFASGRFAAHKAHCATRKVRRKGRVVSICVTRKHKAKHHR